MTGKALFVRKYFRRAASALIITCILGGLVLAIEPHGEPRQYRYDVWQTEQGLPRNTISAILQTQDGYIWLATEAGLVRFDGLNFTIFDKQSTPEFKSNYVRSLFEDRDGNLWVGTADGLLKLKNGGFTEYTAKDGLESNNVRSVNQDRSGNLWIITTSGLAKYKDGKFTHVDGLSSDNVEVLFEDHQGCIWIGTTDGLDQSCGDHIKSFTKSDGLTDNHVRAIIEDALGNLWIGTSSGLNLYKDGQFSAYTAKNGLPDNSAEFLLPDQNNGLWIGSPNGLSRLSNDNVQTYTTTEGLPDNRVTGLYKDREGSIWISTSDGMARYDQGKFTPFTVKDGLSSNTILATFEDREGNLWLGTESGGLNVIKDKRVQSYSTSEGLSDDLIRAIYQDRKSNIWIGTNNGLNLLKDGKITKFTTKDGLSSNVIFAIYGDPEGNLWLGTPDGLDRYKDGKFTTYSSAEGLADDFVRSILEDSKGQLWVGTRRGLTQYKDGRFTTYSTLDGLASDLVGALLEAKDGSLWIGTLGGLSQFKDGIFTTYTTKEGLPSNVVISLYQDADGAIWIGTNGNGLSRFKDGKFSNYSTRDGLFDDVVYRILEDNHTNLWMSSNKGIFRISRQELNAFASGQIKQLHPSVYGTADGMLNRECNGGGHPAGWKTADNKLWFSTVKGVAVIDPDNLKVNTLPAPVVIEQVTIDNHPIDSNSVTEISPGAASFAFQYAGLSFIAPQKVEYKYKLEGFDPDWIPSDGRRVAYYTNIPPGQYTFRVMASNNDGVWNESGAAYSFYLKPHFYQTYWFYALLLIALLFSAWQIYQLRLRRVQAQYAAVLGERNRIAREIHDTLAQGLVGISVQLELVSRLLSKSTETAKTHLDQARVLVRQNLADARRSVWDLRSQALENNDLPTSLSNTAKQIAANAGVPVQLQVSGTFRPLPKEIENNLLRIGQEAVTNAIKHAKPQQIDIALKFDSDIVRLAVQDDGCGFNPEQSRTAKDGHFGLLGMRERAQQIHGKLNVSSIPGEGTEISIEVPISAVNHQ